MKEKEVTAQLTTILELEEGNQRYYCQFKENIFYLNSQKESLAQNYTLRSSLEQGVRESFFTFIGNYLSNLGIAVSQRAAGYWPIVELGKTGEVQVECDGVRVFSPRPDVGVVDGYIPILRFKELSPDTLEVEASLWEDGRWDLCFVTDALTLLYAQNHTDNQEPAVKKDLHQVKNKSGLRVAPLSQLKAVLERAQYVGKMLDLETARLDPLYNMAVEKEQKPECDEMINLTRLTKRVAQLEYEHALLAALGRKFEPGRIAGT